LTEATDRESQLFEIQRSLESSHFTRPFLMRSDPICRIRPVLILAVLILAYVARITSSCRLCVAF